MGYSSTSLKESAVKSYLNNNPINEVAKHYHVNRTTIYRWIKQYEKDKSVARKSNPGSGRPSKLDSKQIRKITKLLLKPASRYGFETDFWTIKRIIKIVFEKFNIKISNTTMYELLYNENYSYKKPEKRFYESDTEKQKDWIENTVPEILTLVKKEKALLYFEDEASISLNSVLGKTWGPKGVTTIQKSTGNKGSISAMSAITTGGRLIFTLHDKRITSVEVIRFLDQILKHHPNRSLVVVMDNARPHTSKITKSYIEENENLHVFYLPPRSPELNPDEKVWNYLKNEELKSHQMKNTKELKILTKNKLMSMSKKPKLLMALFKRCDVSELYLEANNNFLDEEGAN